jgi:dienelactone hydrolase
MKPVQIRCALLLCLLAGQAIAETRSQFQFEGWDGPPLQVFVTVSPEGAANDPVVFVMHGQQRNAEEYRDQWHELAMQHGFTLVVPEFSREAFPGSAAYNLGNVRDGDGRRVTSERWSYHVIEPLFDALNARFGLGAESYSIYGHSAGGQFVHRFLMHVPDARVSKAVAANAGWYTLPDFSINWPYGLNGSGVSPVGLVQALGSELTILLGDQDTDRTAESLRQTAEAAAQGPHRLARGYYFFAAGRRAAAHRQVPIRWKLAEVKGVAHDNARMAPAAVQFLLPQPAQPGSE